MERTPAQTDALRHIEKWLGRALAADENEDVLAADGDLMVRVRVGGYELWLYENGADISGRGTDERFEIYDYDDAGALYEDFKRRVSRLPS